MSEDRVQRVAQASERRAALRERLREADGVDPGDVISPPERAREVYGVVIVDGAVDVSATEALRTARRAG